MVILICAACGLGADSILRSWPPRAVCWCCTDGGAAARCRVRFFRVGIVRIVGGVLSAGGISGARLHGLRTGGRLARVAFHVPIHTLRCGGQCLTLLWACPLSKILCTACHRVSAL